MKLEKIPDFLSKKLNKLIIRNYAWYGEVGYEMKIKSLSNLSLYSNLKIIELDNLHINKITGDFSKLTLDRLELSFIHGLEDISGIFSTNKIELLNITDCDELQVISANKCNSYIKKFIIKGIEGHSGSNVQNIDFLLHCDKINTLSISGCSGKLRLQQTENMGVIPNMVIANNNFYIIKKDGKVTSSKNLDDYIKK